MSTIIDLEYSVTFGDGDGSDCLSWSITLDDKAEAAYNRAKKLRLPLDEVPELSKAFSAACSEIEEEEIQNALEYDEDYVLECTGRYPVDPDEINDLVADRDDHTIEFFGLEGLSDEELDEWDANDLDELPNVCDFDEEFEAESPFDVGWTLNIEFEEHPEDEDLEYDEANETLHELFEEASGDYSTISDYVERCEELYVDGDLSELAENIARELGIEDYK